MPARVDMDSAAITRLLHGAGARQARRETAERVKAGWEANIRARTGETALLLSIDEATTAGRTYIRTGEAGPLSHQAANLSAWKWLEYGTSKMAAQAPGRKALGEAAVS